MKPEANRAAGRPSVSVVIPCRNEARHIERLLDALLRQELRPIEILVVDGGSVLH